MQTSDAQVSRTHFPSASGNAANLAFTSIHAGTRPAVPPRPTQRERYERRLASLLLPRHPPANGESWSLDELAAPLIAAETHLTASKQPGRSEAERGPRRGDAFILTAPATRPRGWSSRSRWLLAVAAVLATEKGISARAGRVSADVCRRVAQIMAEAADGRTGAHSALSRTTIASRAKCSVRAVQYARSALSQLGLAVETVRGRHLTRLERTAALHHHGRLQIRAASTWTLQMLREHAKALAVDTCTPPRRGSTPSNSSSFHYSPKTVKREKPRETPSLPAQRLAAKVIARAPQLWRGHANGLARIFDTYGIATWKLSALFWMLDTDTRERGWTSLARVERPHGWWRWKLGQCSERIERGIPADLVYAS